jgi:cytochrome oxidase Cu insertion factor (SCO1/SenC/PrrC family)
MADTAVKSGKVVIQDATKFISWAIQSSISSIIFKYVSDEDICLKGASLKATLGKLKPVLGIMKLHVVMGITLLYM